jgi:hypothetical protein
MKKSISVLVLISTIASCSHMQYGVVYTADTTKKAKCDPLVYTEAIIEDMFKPITNETMKKAEEYTGYSECTVTYPDKDAVLTDCKKPILYKGYLSKKKAGCDKFMFDNKLI